MTTTGVAPPQGPAAAPEAVLHPALGASFTGRANGSSRTVRARAKANRALDLTACAVAAPFALVVGLPVAMAIKLGDGGPVFFVHERTGYLGRRFRMLKFRTMCTDAERLKASLQHLNQVAGPDFKIPDDPRVTRVGRILRKTHVDELPQLLNVVRGEMSLVGPRPTFIDPTEFSSWHLERLDVRPGLTGPWQIRGTGIQASFDERVRLDIEFVRDPSPGRYLQLVARTLRHLLRPSGH